MSIGINKTKPIIKLHLIQKHFVLNKMTVQKNSHLYSGNRD